MHLTWHGLCSKFAFWVKMPKINRPGSQDFQHLANFSLIWGCLLFIRFMGSPDCEDIKIAMWEVNFRDMYRFNPSFEGLGAWMTFKKTEMAKTLRNGLSMSKTDHLNHK